MEFFFIWTLFLPYSLNFMMLNFAFWMKVVIFVP